MFSADMESASPVRLSLQAAGELPEKLSASSDVGVNLGAMMGDQLYAKLDGCCVEDGFKTC